MMPAAAPPGASLDELDPPEWAPFAAALRQGALTTSTLHRWTGQPIGIGTLQRRTGLVLGGTHDGQHRVISLVAKIDGEVLTLAHATAEVRLDVLPDWARQVLCTTRLPLGRTLHRIGATRRWTSATTLPSAAARPGDPAATGPDHQLDLGASHAGRALAVRASFTLPGHGVIAAVEEFFSPVLLALRHDAPTSVPDLPPDQLIDDADRALLEALRRRRQLARPVRSADGSPPPAYPVHNELLLHQLRAAFGREIGPLLYSAITRQSPTVVVPLPEQRDRARLA